MFRHCTIVFVLATVSALAITQAHAVQRTHVSAAIGDDVNIAFNCTPVAPCRTFQVAMTVTDSNGEVVVLDSGGYGAVTITQSVALIAPTGVYAGISVFPGADGVTIATPGVNVVLRGLTINGQGGESGINMTAGSRLAVENCVISNMRSNGIFVTGATIVRISDAIVRDNISGVELADGVRGTITRSIISGHVNAQGGVTVRGSVANTLTTADIADSIANGNIFGIVAQSLQETAVVKISVRDSRVVANSVDGLLAQSRAGAVVSLSASNNIVSNNLRSGISAENPGAKVWASSNTVSDNLFAGLGNVGGTFGSAGNNAVRNNGLDTSGNITPVGTR